MSNLLYSAGVLFYCKCRDGNIYFLLGREYDNKWSDFGGKSEPKDRCEIENTASREAWEESMGCVFDQENLRSTLKYKKTPYKKIIAIFSKITSNIKEEAQGELTQKSKI